MSKKAITGVLTLVFFLRSLVMNNFQIPVFISSLLSIAALLFPLTANANLIGDTITISVEGDEPDQTFLVTDGLGEEAVFDFGSDESIHFDVGADDISITFFDFTRNWFWDEGLVSDNVVIIKITSLDWPGGGINDASVTGTLFNSEPVIVQLDGPDALTLLVPNNYGITDGTSQANIVVHLSHVPVPAAVWLFGSGLLGLIGVARRKKS